MFTKRKKFETLQELENEIRKLKLRATQIENEFDDNFSYLQKNYLSMTVNSVIPDKTKFKGIPAVIISLILENGRLRDILIKLIEELIDRTSEGIDYITQKLKRKKDL